jgi:hypothetical protein
MTRMTPTELKNLCSKLYGQHWQAQLYRAIGRSPGTISKWANGVNRVPKVAEVRIRELGREQR